MNDELMLPPRAPIAIVRLSDLSKAVEIARALLAGGITALEYTLTNRDALRAIHDVRAELGDAVQVGVGTVLTAADAQASIDAGAQFLVTPALVPEVIDVARERNVVVASGAFTPTEILTAWRRGAQLVKVFPARSLGPAYIKDVLAPLPDLRLVPTGGVDLQTCTKFLDAGAYTVALGSHLVDERQIRAGDWAGLTATARQYVALCQPNGARS